LLASAEQSLARLAAHVEGPAFDATAKANGHRLSLKRMLDVPAELLFRCWTEPELMKPWFCPKPWRVSDARVDLRSGGGSHTTMEGPNGERHENPGSYLHVVPNRELVFTDLTLADWAPNPDLFLGFTGQLLFEPQADGQTLYTAICRHSTDAKRQQHADMGFHDGWGTALDQLIEFAATLRNS
jgi:uncharacterized protein YndB with AHSA1/START domain